MPRKGDDIHRAEIHRFTCTRNLIFRNNSLSTIVTEPEGFCDLRERITGILLEEIRAGVPARPATHTPHTIDGHIHTVLPVPLFVVGTLKDFPYSRYNF